MDLHSIIGSIWRTWPFWVGLLLIFILVLNILKPPKISKLIPHPNPAKNYEEAIRRIDQLRRSEPPDMVEICRLRFMTHSRKMEHAIVMVHGYTNCPQQFAEFGQCFYERGFNVLIAPLPYHGLQDRMSPLQSRLTAEDLVHYTDEMVDIARGLGGKVDISGISGGGLISAYAAQFRSDINLATIIAPAFGYKNLPLMFSGVLINLLSILPNIFVWWDRTNKDRGGISHAYPRFSTRALVQVWRVGQVVLFAAGRYAPASKRFLMITNASDQAVNQKMSRIVLNGWRKFGAEVTDYEFPAELNLDHDIIEPENPRAQVDIVYPKLIELMTR